MTTSYVNQDVWLTQSGTKLTDFTLFDSRTTQYHTAGLTITDGAANCEVSVFDIGPTKDNSILIYTPGVGNIIRDGKVHDSYYQSTYSAGIHGVYDKGRDTRVENVESWNHPNGSCFSPRQPNVYVRCTARDSRYGFGVFDYSDGQGYPLIVREASCVNLSQFFIYIEGIRHSRDTDAALGNSTFGVEIDHATLDLRACKNLPSPIDLGDCHKDCWITNSVVVWDGPGPWYTAPKDGHKVVTDGTVVVSTASFASYLTADYKPAPGSPLIGRAGQSPPRTYAAFGNLPDVGRYQAPPVDVKAAVADLKAIVDYANAALKSLAA